MVPGQYLGSNPQRQYDPPQQLSTCCPGPAGNTTLFMNPKNNNTYSGNYDSLSLSFSAFLTHNRSISLPVRSARAALGIRENTRLGEFFQENPLQFSSMLVTLQRRSQQGTAGTQLAINCSNSPGVFVNTAAWRNWHNCQVSAQNKPGILLASPVRVIKGTCFWRRSQGHITREHVGATVRLIKWLPLISAMHMKGLCLLHDRFYASSPRDLPRCTRTEAGRKTMYHMYSLILTLSTATLMFACVCICKCVCAPVCESACTHIPVLLSEKYSVSMNTPSTTLIQCQFAVHNKILFLSCSVIPSL